MKLMMLQCIVTLEMNVECEWKLLNYVIYGMYSLLILIVFKRVFNRCQALSSQEITTVLDRCLSTENRCTKCERQRLITVFFKSKTVVFIKKDNGY